MINKSKILYKLSIIIEYLEHHNGHDYKLYNHLCPDYGEPDSDIVEYATDVLELISQLFDIFDIIENINS